MYRFSAGPFPSLINTALIFGGTLSFAELENDARGATNRTRGAVARGPATARQRGGKSNLRALVCEIPESVARIRGLLRLMERLIVDECRTGRRFPKHVVKHRSFPGSMTFAGRRWPTRGIVGT
jgi:hypothetical protein